MAYQDPQSAIGFVQASTSFASTDQYCLVKFSTPTNAAPGDIRISDTQGEFCNGVLDDLGAETSGSACRVVIGGLTKFRASTTHAAIAVNTILYSGGAGTGHTATSSGYSPVGYALEAVAADTTAIIAGVFIQSLNQRTTRSEEHTSELQSQSNL